MKADLKKRWVEALRSDQYQQTTCALENEQGFCCLGVACAIFAEEVDLNIIPWGTDSMCTEYGGNVDVLPEKLQKYLEIDEKGTFPKPVEVDTPSRYIAKSLMALNDDARYTFKQIADVIEEQF